jgi:hypothetical protein
LKPRVERRNSSILPQECAATNACLLTAAALATFSGIERSNNILVSDLRMMMPAGWITQMRKQESQFREVKHVLETQSIRYYQSVRIVVRTSIFVQAQIQWGTVH